MVGLFICSFLMLVVISQKVQFVLNLCQILLLTFYSLGSNRHTEILPLVIAWLRFQMSSTNLAICQVISALYMTSNNIQDGSLVEVYTRPLHGPSIQGQLVSAYWFLGLVWSAGCQNLLGPGPARLGPSTFTRLGPPL